MTDYHIAEINIAHMRATLEDPIMKDFVDNLDRINAVADNARGFVWRLQTEEGDATSIRVFDNDMLIVNMSVWESIEALFQYVYASDHVDIFRRRGEWFTKMDTPVLAMWWIPAGHIPTLDEAKEKLDLMAREGPTPLAFTFKKRFSVDDFLAQSSLSESAQG
jgi:hypothetical protein